MTTLNAPSPSDLADVQQQLHGKFDALAKRVRSRLLAVGAARVIGAAVLTAIASLLIDWWFEPGRGLRIVLLLVGLGGLGAIAWRDVLRPLRLPLDPLDLAAALDRAAAIQHERDVLAGTNGSPAPPPLAARVASIMQLPALQRGIDEPSQAMIQRAVGRSWHELESLDLATRLDSRPARQALLATAGFVIVPLILASLAPQASGLWARRWLLASSERWPRYTTLELVGAADGRLVLPRGEPATLRVKATDARGKLEAVWLTIDRESGEDETVTLTQFSADEFRYELPPLAGPATLWVEGGDNWAGPYPVKPVDRPRPESMVVSFTNPRTNQREAHDLLAAEAGLALLTGSDVTLSVASQTPLEQLLVLGDPSGAPSFQQTAPDRFEASWTHNAAMHLRVELVSQEAGLHSLPTPIAIGLKEDRAPRTTLRFRGVRQRITPVATIPLAASARDDFGIRTLSLKATAERLSQPADDADAPEPAAERGGPTVALYLADEGKPLQHATEQEHEFASRTLDLKPGDLLRLSAEATDDCHLGAQAGPSRMVVFQIVSEEELFRELLLRQQAMRAELRKALNEARAEAEELAAAPDGKQLASISRRFRLNQRSVWQVRQGLSATAEEMRLNQLGGPEAFTLMQEKILSPMATLDATRLTPQRRRLASLDPADAAAIVTAADEQQAIVSELEAILKAMSQWDSFIDVVNQLNEVIKLQSEVREQTGTLKEAEIEGIFE